ncbi:MAG: DUF4811 domain-containing protein [Streptococcaceae bacterium]|jgi:hypothetical protein|nr:DUF4811 domain-containing protein [Streptococcaceae bacterium]
MILLFIALFTVLSFVGFMYIDKKVTRNIVGGLSLALLVVSVAGLIYHLSTHWGMKEVTKTTEQQVYTAGDTKAAFGLMIDQEIGTQSGEYVFVYRDKPSDAKPIAHFTPDEKHITDAVKKSATYKMTSDNQAKVVTKTTTYAYSSDLMKMMFGIGDEEGTLVSEKSTVYVPQKTWLLLNTEQAKELESKAADLKKAAIANPEQTAKMQQLAKTDPEKYAQLQVEQIKKLLNI